MFKRKEKFDALMRKTAVRLDEKLDAFTVLEDLVKGGKSPVPILFEPYKDKISSQKKIKEAAGVNDFDILSESEDTAFKKAITK